MGETFDLLLKLYEKIVNGTATFQEMFNFITYIQISKLDDEMYLTKIKKSYKSKKRG